MLTIHVQVAWSSGVAISAIVQVQKDLGLKIAKYAKSIGF
jgi:hypothetical protein